MVTPRPGHSNASGLATFTPGLATASVYDPDPSRCRGQGCHKGDIRALSNTGSVYLGEWRGVAGDPCVTWMAYAYLHIRC